MEKWKIATIAALLLSLIGFGMMQRNSEEQAANPEATPGGTPGVKPASATYLGKTPPPWNFKIWNSKPVSLASLQGKSALVEIFRTECPHCRDVAPFLAALNKRYGPRGLKIVSIQSPGDFKSAENPENSWPAVQTWLKNYGVTHPVAFDEGSQYFQGTVKKQILQDDPNKLLYPTIWLLDPSGKIDFAQTGHDTGKAIALAIEIEKRFPTSSSNSAAQNAADLTKWLTSHMPELQADKAMAKALSDDIALRLKK